MPASTVKRAYFDGFRDGLPFIVLVSPFAMLFGVVAAEAGLSVLQILSFSAAVFAGAAQFTALQLMVDQAPTIVVLASALAVNLRLVMYSATLTPHLGKAPFWQRVCIAYFVVDQSFLVAIAGYEREPGMCLRAKVAFFFGAVSPVVPFWFAMSVVGALIGTTIPDTWPLDFALPIAFIAMIAPMIRSAAHVSAAMVGVVAALLLAGLPYNLGLLLAGLCGMMAGARVELWMERRP